MVRRRERGYSLIEVLISLGLLAGVLISMAGLMVFGDRQVRGGRTASEALSVAQTILERMQSWGFHQTYQTFGFDGSSTSYSVDTRSSSAAAAWQATLQEKLSNSYATIELLSLGPTSPAPAMSGTNAIRVIVTIHWEEGPRPRTVQLSAVRM